MTSSNYTVPRKAILGIGLAVAVCAQETVAARDPWYSDGVITAVSYEEISDRISLQVVPYDDTDLDLLIEHKIVEALRRAKHTIDVAPLFELSFSAHFHTAQFLKKQPSLGELSVGDDMKLNLNIWSSTGDSVITGRQGRSGYSGRTDFEIHVSLRELSLGKVVWEGRATTLVDRNQAERVVPSMANALVSNLGRTVRNERFPVN